MQETPYQGLRRLILSLATQILPADVRVSAMRRDPPAANALVKTKYAATNQKLAVLEQSRTRQRGYLRPRSLTETHSCFILQ